MGDVSDMYAKSLKAFLKPIAAFLDDKSVSEIMINGPEEIWVEKSGCVYLTSAKFTEEGLVAAARNMAQYVGRIINDERPRLDARLPDGSRIHVVLPPIGRKGTTIAIRKFFPGKLTIKQLVDFQSMTAPMARFLDACVTTAQNMVVSGGTGSGKTTLLNVVSSLIPNEERILTIEDSAELQMQQSHLVPFESRPPDKLGKGAVTMADLLKSALRLRPDRIVIGEVRGGEAFDLVQSMNTGHSGSMCTVHANTPTDTLRRIESLCLMSDVDIPMVAIRSQVAAALNVIVCCGRLHDGSRRTTHISEVLPLNEKGDYRTQDIFIFTITGKDENGKFTGYHAPTGIIPTFLNKVRAFGFTEIDEEFFDPGRHGLKRPPVRAIQEFKVRWVDRLADGEEQSPPEPFDAEKQKEMEAAYAKTLEERDLIPPPEWPGNGDEAAEKAPEAKPEQKTDSGEKAAEPEEGAEASETDDEERKRHLLAMRRRMEARREAERSASAASLLSRQLKRQKEGLSSPGRRIGLRPKRDDED
ncbi:MAG: CpaF family protein [Deltaproteobacteria bacterium]|nr:CpaF family protein [Deltaproteobacteria bacterium]